MVTASFAMMIAVKDPEQKDDQMPSFVQDAEKTEAWGGLTLQLDAGTRAEDVELFRACSIFAILHCILSIFAYFANIFLCFVFLCVAALQIAVCSSGQVTSDKTSIWQGGCPMVVSMGVP